MYSELQDTARKVVGYIAYNESRTNLMTKYKENIDRLRGNPRPQRENSVYYMKNVPELPDDWTWPTWYLESLKAMKGSCIWCGNDLLKRKRKYCSNSCSRSFRKYAANYDLSVTSLRRYVHKYFNFQCNHCGEHMSAVTPAGVEYPVHNGHVDHVVPLFQGGDDAFKNLQLLCVSCHQIKTIEERK